MTFSNPAHRISRSHVAGHEGHWIKVFDPPEASPETPELVAPTNPVPSFMEATVPGTAIAEPEVVWRPSC